MPGNMNNSRSGSAINSETVVMPALFNAPIVLRTKDVLCKNTHYSTVTNNIPLNVRACEPFRTAVYFIRLVDSVAARSTSRKAKNRSSVSQRRYACPPHVALTRGLRTPALFATRLTAAKARMADSGRLRNDRFIVNDRCSGAALLLGSGRPAMLRIGSETPRAERDEWYGCTHHPAQRYLQRRQIRVGGRTPSAAA